MNYIAHHGIKGMKWGIRRYQNSDGSLTPEGRARYLTRYKGETTDDLSIEGGKAVRKFLKKNPGSSTNALLSNEWEHEFGTYEFMGEVLKKYGGLIDKGKIFTSEFADMHALLDLSQNLPNEFFMNQNYARVRQEQRARGVKLTVEADKIREDERSWSVNQLEIEGAHKSDFAKARGLSTPSKVYDYFKKTAENLNAMNSIDPLRSSEGELRRLGYISEETFSKLQDAQLSRDVYQLWEDVMSTPPEEYSLFDEWHDADQKK